MQPNEREQQVFRNLAESGEGEVLAEYLERVRRHLTDELVDKRPTPAQIEGAALTRQLCAELKERLNNRAIMTPQVDSFV